MDRYKSLVGDPNTQNERIELLKKIAAIEDRELLLREAIALESSESDGSITTHHASVMLVNLWNANLEKMVQGRDDFYKSQNPRIQMLLMGALLLSRFKGLNEIRLMYM